MEVVVFLVLLRSHKVAVVPNFLNLPIILLCSWEFQSLSELYYMFYPALLGLQLNYVGPQSSVSLPLPSFYKMGKSY